MLTLWVTLKLILGQTMLEGEAIAAFQASPFHRGTTKIVVPPSFFFFLRRLFPVLAGLAIWHRLDNANTLGNTEVNFGPDDA